MPYRTTWEDRGIVWTFYGHVTAAEIEAANEAFSGDPRSDYAKYQIIDASEVTELEWSNRDVAMAAAHDIGADSYIKNVKVAAVSQDLEVVAMLQEYGKILRRMETSWRFGIFAELARARAWAGAPTP